MVKQLTGHHLTDLSSLALSASSHVRGIQHHLPVLLQKMLIQNIIIRKQSGKFRIHFISGWYLYKSQCREEQTDKQKAVGLF